MGGSRYRPRGASIGAVGNGCRRDPRFDPQVEADAIERLCERVDGLPLALQLSARGILDAGLAAVLAWSKPLLPACRSNSSRSDPRLIHP